MSAPFFSSQVETETQLRFVDGSRFNISADSKIFDCKLIEPGIVSYRDQSGNIELLRKETLDRCMASVVGNPLTLHHTQVTAENRTDVEQGIVNEWSYNSEDGWYYVKGVADTEPAKARMRAGAKPSCGYQVRQLGAGGVYHGIRYDAEILDLVFNHLAIVDRPRYEGASFRLNSIANNSTMNVFKLLKKIVTRENDADGKPVEATKVVPHDISGESEIEIDGQKVRLNELFETYLKETAEAFTTTPEDSFEISGKAVTMGQLADAYRKNRARANAAATETPEQKAKLEKDEAAAKAQRDNAAAEKEKAEKAARKNNTSAFFTLHVARTDPKIDGGFSTSSGSLKEKCERGAKRY